jgi:hypothetical protein
MCQIMKYRHTYFVLIVLLLASSSIASETNGGWLIPSLLDVDECKKAREDLDTNQLRKDANGFPKCRGDRGPTLKLDQGETPTYLAAAYSLFSSGELRADDEHLGKFLATAILAGEGQFGEPHVGVTRHTCLVVDQTNQQIECQLLITWYEAKGDGAPYSTYRIDYQAKRIKAGKYQLLDKTVKIDSGFE